MDGSLKEPTNMSSPLTEHFLRCNNIIITRIQKIMFVQIKYSTFYVNMAIRIPLKIYYRMRGKIRNSHIEGQNGKIIEYQP